MPNPELYARHETGRLLAVLGKELERLGPLDALLTVRGWCYDLGLDYRGRPLDPAERTRRALDAYQNVPYSPAVGVGVAFYQSNLEDHNDDQK